MVSSRKSPKVAYKWREGAPSRLRVRGQRCGEIVLDEGDLAYQDDCTLVDVPTDCAAFVTPTHPKNPPSQPLHVLKYKATEAE